MVDVGEGASGEVTSRLANGAPVQENRQRRRRLFEQRIKQESIAADRGNEMVKRDALHRSDARAEKRRRCSCTQFVRTVTRLQWHGHKLAVKRQVEDLQSVSAPPGLCPTINRDTCARSVAAH